MRKQHRWTGLFILAVAATAALLSSSSVAEQPGDDKSFEKNLDAGLRDVINLGSTIFNKQDDHAGCYRLFEGSLRSIKPLLGKYPQLQTKIDVGLADAGKQVRMHDKAHTLRKVLDDVRATINPGTGIVAKASLWDRLGGEKGVDKVLSDFMAAAAMDPKVDFSRGGKYKLDDQKAQALKKSLIDFVSDAAGGPYKYKGPSMKDVHKGMGITDDQFNALAGHLKEALEKNGVKTNDVAAVMEAVGGTRGDIVEPKVEPKKVEDTKPGKKAPFVPDPNMARVKGVVTIDGQPLTHGFVTFLSVTDKRYSANIMKDGSFVFHKGFPPGEYKVLVEETTTPAEPGEKRLTIPLQYTAPILSTLTFTATKGENTMNLKLETK
ncbi:MAG TPA: group 1 truncated hemoglobin [Gemmataceae bacterium]|nr:group 1 truncated hemoglobin [Gemmataceae bacterium]